MWESLTYTQICLGGSCVTAEGGFILQIHILFLLLLLLLPRFRDTHFHAHAHTHGCSTGPSWRMILGMNGDEGGDIKSLCVTSRTQCCSDWWATKWEQQDGGCRGEDPWRQQGGVNMCEKRRGEGEKRRWTEWRDNVFWRDQVEFGGYLYE